MSDNGAEDADLPDSLTIFKFAAARKREVQVMKKSLSTTTAVKLAFQKLPRHMRRRAMSHNVKRLPRRLREIHLSQQLKSGLPPKQKRPSRKYRRRPFSLTSEYVRRQRRVIWLNTHIWHAKRFHMIEKWCYKIPYSPCDRAFRACYRATVKHCLLQDISYYACLEIVGKFEDIVDKLAKITDCSQGLSISAKPFRDGLREGSIIICTTANRKIIGTIQFNWKPKRETDSSRVLWLWCHAAYYSEMFDALVACFELKACSDDSEQKYSNGEISVNILKWDLSRFRLTGPLSNAILQNALKLEQNISKSPDWVKQYLTNTSTDTFTSPHDYWEQLKFIASPTEISPHVILPLIITDPRYNFPKIRTKALPNHVLDHSITLLKPVFFASPLWDQNVRKLVQDSKLSNAKLAELRQELLVPGTDLHEPPVPIPIMLIQRPGRKKTTYTGYGNGWDIVLPSSWAQPVWLSLIMWGARSGGLRENDSLMFESGSEHFLYPDSASGEKEENDVSEKLKEKFFRLPPSKRTNYAKFKITSPFNWNWKLLLNEWSSNGCFEGNLVVIRDKKLLGNVQDVLSKKSKVLHLDLPENCLIPVQITLLKKGSCRKFSIICLPEDRDLKREPVEPDCNDPNEQERKDLRRAHITLLKRLKKERKMRKRKGEVVEKDKTILKNYTSQMRKLWLPDATNIRNSCCREVMGFVKHGDFSFLAAKSKAIGYITSSSLTKLLSTTFKNKVLLRNTNSKQYRLGLLEVICD